MALEAWFRVEPSQLVRIKLWLRQNGRRNSGARRRAWRRRGARKDSAIPVRPRRQRRSDTAREEGEDHSVQAELSFFSFSSSSRHLNRASNLPSFSSFNSSRPSTAFKVRGATRGQGRTHGDQRTWWRGLRIADRRKTFTLRLIVQVTGFRVTRSCREYSRFSMSILHLLVRHIGRAAIKL